MNRFRWAAYYAIVVGILMLAQWVFFIAAGEVSEFEDEPFGTALHIAAEGVTALMLIAGGYGLLKGRRWAFPIYPVALGMLLYAVIQAAGYFIDQRGWPLVIMFAVLFGLTLLCIRFSLAHYARR
ncbi:MAG: hypothetical protein HRF48_03605 [Chloroflexota bacterium]|jgi:hypothetical protein